MPVAALVHCKYATSGDRALVKVEYQGLRFWTLVVFEGLSSRETDVLGDALSGPDLMIAAPVFEVDGCTRGAYLLAGREGNLTLLNDEIEDRKACLT
jgi:hypothetical protein